MSETNLIRPRSNLVFAGANYILLSGLAFAEIEARGAFASIGVFAWMALFGFANHLVLVVPRIRTDASGLTIVNPLRTHFIAWRDIEEIDARFTMYVRHSNRKTQAWAAPVPGRYHSRNVLENELRGSGLNRMSSIKAGELPNSHSGVALIVCRREWQRFLGKPEDVATSWQRWNNQNLLISTILAIMAISIPLL